MITPFGNMPKAAPSKESRVYINLVQFSTTAVEAKPGLLYRSDNKDTTESITGVVVRMHPKRVYRNDSGLRCYSPDAEVGKGVPGVHQASEAYNHCGNCQYRQKEDGGKSPCMIIFEVTLLMPDLQEVVVELKKTSYPTGMEVMNILGSLEEPWTQMVTFSSDKIKKYYIMTVQDAGPASAELAVHAKDRMVALMTEWGERRYAPSLVSAEPAPNNSLEEEEPPF